ncbi:tumor necrosis factor ligand superfamily member 14 [Hemibagrus wyckioides]|uniref:tumor necrosis factor ligand superfamily member 14 n=1 Tax=Hemibagrus wyckioides TaxID=337641 RepID=UPI00266C4150|nr:tumor necrosis factor ligand superfamily member 14 [Hemibagrus wyckioides]
MADGRFLKPSVFVVDGGTGFPPPLPPKPGQRRIQKRKKLLIQNLLVVLVCLALAGLLVEGFFIYRLHHTNQTQVSIPAQPKTEALQGERIKEQPSKESRPPTIPNPSKPLAHLTVAKKPEKEGIVEWNGNENGESFVYQFKYKDGKLIVRKEGYYYVYSKLSYSADSTSFSYTVERDTTRYLGKSITLLRHNRYNAKPVHKSNVRDSYLGGVFHLLKDDGLFVHVSNGSLIRLYMSADNFFGMFML